MQKNQKIILTIESYGAFGEGIAHADDSVIFIPFAMKGERVEAQVLSVKKGIAFAKLIRVIEPSQSRVEPFCPYFTKCGGCDIQHIEYSEQLRIKADQVSSCIQRIARITPPGIEIHPSQKRLECRNKLTLPFGVRDGLAVLGFYSERSHRVIAIDSCPLGVQTDKIIRIFTSWANRNAISVYSEESGKGLLRAVSARVYGGRFMLTLVASSERVPCINELVDRLNAELDSPVIYLNVNRKQTNVILGDKNIHLSGDKTLRGEALGVRFELSPFSFAQVNNEVRDELYSRVLSLVGEGDTVIDAYSGAGLMSVLLAKKANKVYGAEIIEDAVRDADLCAKQNGVSHKVINRAGDCAVLMPEIVKEIGKADSLTVVLDPPRKGCDKSVLDSVIGAKPQKVIYVSCNPATLARDLAVLGEKYELTSVDVFDMFPNTKHVESVVCLTSK